MPGLAENLARLTGLAVERRAEGVMLADSGGRFTDKPFPGRGGAGYVPENRHQLVASPGTAVFRARGCVREFGHHWLWTGGSICDVTLSDWECGWRHRLTRSRFMR